LVVVWLGKDDPLSASPFLRWIAITALAASASMTIPAYATAAITIDYSIVDLADTVSGVDRWRYDYTVDGRAFEVDDSINIYFDFGSNGELISRDIGPLTAPANFKPEATDPDQVLGPGLFVATALTADPGQHLSFSAAFTWLGAGTPGLQYFEILDPNFNVLELGTTTISAIPEPATGFLLASGLTVMLAARRARRQAPVGGRASKLKAK
jgi:hypothetical protein